MAKKKPNDDGEKRKPHRKPEPKKPEPQQEAPQGGGVTRRQWLGLAGGGLAAGAAGLAYHLSQGGKEAAQGGKDAEQASGNALPTQEDVTREYNALYEHIAEAKKQADAEKKPLVVLMGEMHNNRNSLLVEFMLVDIGQRLGITQIMDEQDKATVALMETEAQRHLDDRDKGILPMLRGVPQKEAEYAKRAFLISPLKAVPHTREYKVENEVQFNNSLLAMMAGKDAGMRFEGVDPTNKQRMKDVMASDNEDLVLDAKYEKPMQQEIQRVAQRGSAIGFLGAAHVPQLVDWLKEDRNVKVVGVDGMSGERLKGIADSPKIRARLDAMDNLYVPGIKTSQQLSPAESLSMVLSASLKHQKAKGELGAEDAAFRQSLVDKVKPQRGAVR